MTPARALAVGLVLTASAGFVDAVGFVVLGGYYTSFMSGNSTQLGVGLVIDRGSLLLPASLVFMFFAGSFLGSIIVLRAGRWGSHMSLGFVMLTVLLAFGLAALGWPAQQALLALAVGAGAQNAVLPPLGAARLGATFVTGTLFAAGQDLARATIGAAPPWRWAQHLLVWASLAAGALLGALLYSRVGLDALVVPLFTYSVLLISLFVRRT